MGFCLYTATYSVKRGKGVDKSKTTSYRPKSANLTKRAVHLGNIEHIFSMTEP